MNNLDARVLTSDICNIAIKREFKIQQFDPTYNPIRIRMQCTDHKDLANRVHDVQHSIYEYLLKNKFTASEPSEDAKQIREFYRDPIFIRVLLNPTEDIHIALSITVRNQPVRQFRSVSNTLPLINSMLAADNQEPQQEKRRLSYRLPPNDRGTLGTGYYTVHYGDEIVGKLVCDDKIHDPDKQKWRCELYKGFDPIAFPDLDEPNYELGEPHVVPSEGSLSLFNGMYGTLGQSRQWIRSIFDRTMWEQATIPY